MYKTYFRKPVFLPSGGLDYPPFVWLTPITNELSIFEYDANRSDSNFAYKLTILEKYANVDFDLLDMYTCDVNYLWSYMMIEDIVTDGIYHIANKCQQCDTGNYVKIDMGSLNVKYLNIYDDKINRQLEYKNEENLLIKFSRRRAKHNLTYGHILFSDISVNSKEYMYQIILFIVTQIDEILFNGKEVPRNEYLSCLRALRFKEIDEILELIINEENNFGIHNKLYYECKKCKSKNTIYLFNDMYESKVGEVIQIPQIQTKQRDLFKNIFEFTRLPIIGYDEYINSPIRFMSGMAKAVQAMEFHAGTIL